MTRDTRTWFADSRELIEIGNSVGFTLPKEAARDAGLLDEDGEIREDVVVELFEEDGRLGGVVAPDD